MEIKQIKIRNCRGIKELIIKDSIIANKPNILVAPNGFGKTSLAHAFASITEHTSFKINEDDVFENDSANIPELKLIIKDGEQESILEANNTNYSNTIRKHFDICVITNPQHIKTNQNFYGSGFTAPKGKLIIDPIVICRKETRQTAPTTNKQIQSAFGKNGNTLIDINVLFNNIDFPGCCISILGTIKQLNTKTFRNQLVSISSEINSIINLDGIETTDSIKDLVSSNSLYQKLSNTLSKILKQDEIHVFGIIWTIFYWLNNYPSETYNYFNFERYQFYKNSLKSIIDNINTSKFKKALVNEKGGNLNVEIPEPKFISNGQRDVLILISYLYKAQMCLKKQNSILVIDEVFDYLDDANLTVAQFYISKLIEDFKNAGRQLFPMLLTHLNPNFFKNYVFSKQKVHYLNEGIQTVTPALQKLIDNRGDANLKDLISKYLLHFHTENYDFQEELVTINGVRSSWGKKGNFEQFIVDEFDKYKAGSNYDPIAICAYTRRRIEEKVYFLLQERKDDFLNQFVTGEKLKIALSTGIEIPEEYFLLRIIYDEGLHSNSAKNNTAAIEAKLSNPIIKNMIVDATK